MTNSRMTDFRKRNVKEAAINQERQQEHLNQLFRLIVGLTGRVLNMEKKLAVLTPVARAADWRSAAIAKFYDKHPGKVSYGFNEDAINELAEELQIENFYVESEEDDKVRGLVSADDEPAADGHFAIVTMKIFKNGQEIKDQKVARSKIEMGAYELFPEMDEALKGMKVGETKEFPLNIQDRTDKAELTLLSLRKKKPPEIPIKEPSEAKPSDN